MSAQTFGSGALLQAVSVVSSSVVWVSGHQGTWGRTTDGGATWTVGRVAGADTLQFRDVEAMSADTAILLGAGNGDLSRIYRTTDGGQSWSLRYTNPDSAAFYDCMSFWDSRRGIAFSDAVSGRFVLLSTSDGGASWQRVPDGALPPAQPGEGSFAASGTCIAARAGGKAWIGTGNAPTARVLMTRDYGESWHAIPVPVRGGEASGLASIIMRDDMHGLAFGGPIGAPDDTAITAAATADGGESWTPVGWPGLRGAVYGAAYVPGASTPTVVAVNPHGVAVSRDDGKSWNVIDDSSAWSVGAASPSAIWIVGPRGRVVRLGLP
jgi:photosystem II stability/assembly factor-like uncharacterized protein